MKMRSSKRSRSPQPANDDYISFTGSVHFDHKLWRYDIAGSIAHAHGLAGAGVLSEDERSKIVSGLRSIALDMSQGKIVLDHALEDIHMNVEAILTDRIGAAGAKLHTGRSRNDQIALDMRLFVRESLLSAMRKTLGLQEQLLICAKDAQKTVMPGYTHMQHAQPVLLTHHLLAHFWRLDRDIARFRDCQGRTNISPLGSGALAGTSFKIDRLAVAKMLGMDAITANSMDAVSDRDFVAEASFDLALLQVHLSSLCEELIIWSSQEFGFLKLPERLSGGSSMMPQKRNPDIPELVRGKSGRALGDLVAILTLLKSLPLAYNRDLQEDKENLFDLVETVEASLLALTTFLGEVEFDRVRMRKAAQTGLMTATDLADLLTKEGLPFRTAHRSVARLTLSASGNDQRFTQLAQDKLQLEGIDHEFFSANRAVQRRDSQGGTSRGAVTQQIAYATTAIQATKKAMSKMEKQAACVGLLVD